MVQQTTNVLQKTPGAAKPPITPIVAKPPIFNAQKALADYQKQGINIADINSFKMGGKEQGVAPIAAPIGNANAVQRLVSRIGDSNAGQAFTNAVAPLSPDNGKFDTDYATSAVGKLEDASKRGLGAIDKSLGGSGTIGEGIGSLNNMGLEFAGYGKALGLAGEAVAPLAKMVARAPAKIVSAPFNILKEAAFKGAMSKPSMTAIMGGAKVPVSSKLAGLAYKGLSKVGGKTQALADAAGNTIASAAGAVLKPANKVLAGSLALGYDAPKTTYDEDGFATNSSLANVKNVFTPGVAMPIDMPGLVVKGLGKSLDEAIERNNPLKRPAEFGQALSGMAYGEPFKMQPEASTAKVFDPRIDDEKAAEAKLAAEAVSKSPTRAAKQTALATANKELEDFQGSDQQAREAAKEAARLELWMAEHNGDVKGYVPKVDTTANKLATEKDEAQTALENRTRFERMLADNAALTAMPKGDKQDQQTLALIKKHKAESAAAEAATDKAEDLKSSKLANEQVTMEKELQAKANEGKPIDNTSKGLEARYEAKRLEAETADKDFNEADKLEYAPDNYELLSARKDARDKELQELGALLDKNPEAKKVAEPKAAVGKDSPEYKTYLAKAAAYNAAAVDDNVDDETTNKLEADMNAAEKVVFPGAKAENLSPYAPRENSTAVPEEESDVAASNTPTPKFEKTATGYANNNGSYATGQKAAVAPTHKFERTATGYADNKGNYITGLDQDAKQNMFRKDNAYPNFEKDYLDNRLANGTLTPVEYAKQLKNPAPSKMQGGTVSTAHLEFAPEAPKTPEDPYAAIISQLTDQMNATGQDFTSRRKAVAAKAMLREVLAHREQGMDRTQRETQAMRDAAERSSRFDYAKGRDATTDARYEAEKQHIFGREDKTDKEKVEDKRYERLQHAKEWLALNENQRAQLQNQKILALRSRLSPRDMYGEDEEGQWGLQDEQ